MKYDHDATDGHNFNLNFCFGYPDKVIEATAHCHYNFFFFGGGGGGWGGYRSYSFLWVCTPF